MLLDPTDSLNLGQFNTTTKVSVSNKTVVCIKTLRITVTVDKRIDSSNNYYSVHTQTSWVRPESLVLLIRGQVS